MTWQFVPFTPVLIFASLLSVGLIFLTWPRREGLGVRYFIGYLAAVAIWTFTNGLEMSVVEPAAKIFLNQVGYLGVVSTAPLTWMFCREFVSQRALPARRYAFLWIIPVLTLLLAWTNPWHHWIWTGFSPGQPGTNVMIYHHGFWFWIILAYVYVLIVLTLGYLTKEFFRTRLLFRWQVGMLILGLAFPVITASIYVSGWEPLAGLDISSLGFALTGLLLSWNLTRWRMFDVIPLAKEVIFKSMKEGVIVLDNLGRVIELNPAAEQITGTSSDHAVGRPALEVFSAFQALVKQFQAPEQEASELEIVIGPTRRYYDVNCSLIKNWRNQTAGQVFILHDITERTDLFNQVNRLATTDALTGIYNRRSLMEMSQKEFSRALRHDQELGVVMMDLDLFKQINDHYGHQVGDEVLRTVAQTCWKMIREGDILGRYGGEEFVILLPNTGPAEAYRVAERLRQRIAQLQFQNGDARFAVTASFGLTSLQATEGISLDDLLASADQAVYRAKAEGRNRVAVFQITPAPGQSARG